MTRLALAVAGVLFLLYPLVRPWEDETTAAGAHAAMASGAWVASHFFAMIGFILVGLALLGLRDRLGTTAVAVVWAGAGLTLTYYGAEDFGLHAAANTAGTDLLAVAEATRYNPVAATTFAVGLIALAVGAVLVGLKLKRPSAWVFAAGFVLFPPQFFTPAPVRIAHGALMLAGLVWLAADLRKDTKAPSVQAPRRDRYSSAPSPRRFGSALSTGIHPPRRSMRETRRTVSGGGPLSPVASRP